MKRQATRQRKTVCTGCWAILDFGEISRIFFFSRTIVFENEKTEIFLSTLGWTPYPKAPCTSKIY
jgi:hypothetical protein